MITIRHDLDNGRQYSTVIHSEHRLYGFATAAYAAGITKPNYPMPAIPVTTLWGRDWCAQYKGWLGNPIDMPNHNINFWSKTCDNTHLRY